MLIVQKFHSIHEIDPEFRTSLEKLLEEEIPSFEVLIDQHDKAPPTDVFTYFLFFGNTQNVPIGLAQLCLRQLSYEDLIPWYRKLMFWNEDYKHWRQAIWKIGDGAQGVCVFDPKFSKSGKVKVQELIVEYAERSDIKSQLLYMLIGQQDFIVPWPSGALMNKEIYVVGPFSKSFASYQDYIQTLSTDAQNFIKNSWKNLDKGDIKLGDYPTVKEINAPLPLESERREFWEQQGIQILTFEKGAKVLGCIQVIQGKNGNYFFEPFPFGQEVDDELYIQYALLKFFEAAESKKLHLMKSGERIKFEDEENLAFFNDQGLTVNKISQKFFSQLEELERPV